MDKQQEEITDIQYITALLEKVFERTNKIQALESNFSDMIFYSLLISVFGIGLVLLANRFIPENFLNFSNVQPYISIIIFIATLILLIITKTVMTPAKKSKKMRK